MPSRRGRKSATPGKTVTTASARIDATSSGTTGRLICSIVRPLILAPTYQFDDLRRVVDGRLHREVDRPVPDEHEGVRLRADGELGTGIDLDVDLSAAPLSHEVGEVHGAHAPGRGEAGYDVELVLGFVGREGRDGECAKNCDKYEQRNKFFHLLTS